MKSEACPFENCRFSKVCNHIHCIRAQCTYVLHSSGQLFSHKRKHERKDSELAYRKFKLAQSMLKNFGIQGNMSESLPPQIQEILKNYSQTSFGESSDIQPSNIHDIITYYQNHEGTMPPYIQELIKTHQNYETAAQNLSKTDTELFRYEHQPENSFVNNADILTQYVQELIKSYGQNYESMPMHIQELIKKYQSMLQTENTDFSESDYPDVKEKKYQNGPLNLSEPMSYNDTIKMYQDNFIQKQMEESSPMSRNTESPLNMSSEKDTSGIKLTDDQIEQIEHLKRLGINLTVDQINGHVSLAPPKIQKPDAISVEVKEDDKSNYGFSDDSNSNSTDSNSLAIDLSGAAPPGVAPVVEVPQEIEKKQEIDWNCEDFWIKYGKYYQSGELCPRDQQIKCELFGKDHYHCIVDPCGMIFK